LAMPTMRPFLPSSSFALNTGIMAQILCFDAWALP
jgi:hypothetical protein